MNQPLRLIARALHNYWDEAFNLLLVNLLWFLSQLLVIPGPPATAALFAVTNRVAHGSLARLADFRDAFRTYFGAGWRWGALNLAAILAFGYAALFYGSGVLPPYGAILSLVMRVLLAAWLFVQLFAFPLWLEQTDRRITLALRNAAVMLAQHLRVALLAALVAAAAVAATAYLWPLVVMVTPALLTTLGNTVVVAQVEALRYSEGLDDGGRRDAPRDP